MGLNASSQLSNETKLKAKHKKTYEMAEYYFDAEEFDLSEKYFGELAENYPGDGYFQFKWGYSLFELDRPLDAIKSFEAAVNLGFKEAHYYKARVHHKLEQFDKAISDYTAYHDYPKKLKTDAALDEQISAVKRAKDAYSNPINVRIKNIGEGINTAYEDYVPLISPDGNKLIFTSKRPNPKGLTKYDDILFEDIYVAEKQMGNWATPTLLAAPINSDQHDANVCFSADGKSLIIYRNDKKRDTGDLYLAEFNNGSWGEPIKLPSNINSPYHEPSAALNPEGDRMYLVSNRPGSIGERDLFLLNKLPNGEWSQPINLGKGINTKYNEDAPFVDPNGEYLYFSSEGHNSIGGFDIFRSKILSDGTLANPENMGFPINSVHEDIYFSITADGKTAYYSSLKVGDTYGEQDIYEIDFLFENQDHVVVKGKVENEKGEPVEAYLEIKDESGKVVQKVFSSPERGNFLMSVLPDRSYEFSASHEDYETFIQTIEPKIARKGEFSILKLEIILKEKRHE